MQADIVAAEQLQHNLGRAQQFKTNVAELEALSEKFLQ